MTKTRDLANLADLNFDSGTMVVDKVNDRVGIANSSPSQLLHIGSTSIASGSPAWQRIQTNGNDMYVGIGSNNAAYIQANGEFKIAAGGYVDRVTVDTSGFVGIGESSPQKMLHITKNDSDGMIVLDANGATTDHQICFSKNYGTGGTTGGNYWGIGVDGSENKLVFAYDPNAQASLAADAKVVLDSSGNVLVGTTSDNPAGTNVQGIALTAAGQIDASRNGGSLDLNRISTDGSIATFRKDGSVVGSIGVDGGDNLYLTGQSGNTGGIYMNDSAVSPAYQGVERDNYYNLGKAPARWKDLYLSGGVFLGGVGSANYLDDYEEGTWTPQIWKGSTQVTSPTSAFGQYRKIGDVIFYSFYFFKNSGSNTDSNLWNLRGMPFAMETAAASGYTCLTAGYTGINSVNYFNQTGSHRWQNNGSSKFDLYGPQQTTQWTSGHIEFAGYGFVYQA